MVRPRQATDRRTPRATSELTNSPPKATSGIGKHTDAHHQSVSFEAATVRQCYFHHYSRFADNFRYARTMDDFRSPRRMSIYKEAGDFRRYGARHDASSGFQDNHFLAELPQHGSKFKTDESGANDYDVFNQTQALLQSIGIAQRPHI